MQNNIFFSGLFIGQNFINLKEVNSTNNFLKDLSSNSKPLPEGTVIMAGNQYAGRGQHQNKWHSEAGKNISASILLNPAFLSITEQFDLNRAISLGITNALITILGSRVKIKWPNDIYYADKKLGGVLIENMVQGDRIKNTVVGIGLNVNQQHFPEYVPNPVSLRQILQRDYELKPLMLEICGHIEGWYLQLKAGKKDLVRKSYLERLYWYNEDRQFKAGDSVFTGKIKGVHDDGLLEVDTGTNELMFDLKQIEFLNK